MENEKLRGYYGISGKEDEVNADFRLGRGIAETDKARVDAERIAVQLLASRLEY